MRNSIIQVQTLNNLGCSLSYGEEERLHLHFTPQNISRIMKTYNMSYLITVFLTAKTRKTSTRYSRILAVEMKMERNPPQNTGSKFLKEICV
jgi:hypothetical protein